MLIINDLPNTFREDVGLSVTCKVGAPWRDGNLCPRLVSNVGRTRATSHPCERGAGLLEN